MQSIVWLDGNFIPAVGAIDASDRGLLLADAVFDTALVIARNVFLREAHVARLRAALEYLEIPADAAAIDTAMDAMAARQIDGSIRLTVTRGPAPRGLRLPADPRPTVLCASAPFVPAAMFLPTRAAITETRRNETSPLAQIKTTGYLDAVLANREAERQGANEALFLNTRGNVACTSLGNVFALSGDELMTPPLADGVLPGILRDWILRHAGSFAMTPVERSIPSHRLHSMDACFVTNSLRFVSPLAIDGPPTEAPVPEAMRRLMEALCTEVAATCGKDPRALGAMLPASAG